MLRSIDDIIPVNRDGIPACLKNLARWVLWKPLPQEDDPGVLTKTPFKCRCPDELASNVRPEHWSNFEAAKLAYDARQANGAGGLMLALGDGLAGVDLDDAIDPATGMPTPEAQRIIDRLQSYTELSVSGTGVRIFVRAQEGPGRKFGRIEIYSKARFLTVTGWQIPGTPDTIEDRAAEVAALRDELEQARRSGRPAVARTSLDVMRLREMFPGVTTLGVPDSEILMRAAEVCGDRFERLWSGDDSGYESRSQADLALAGDLAFVCGPGEEQRVEAIMRQSGLVRSKWGREDYLSGRTIPRAYEDREDFYRWEILQGIGRRPPCVSASCSSGDGPDAETDAAVEPAVTATPEGVSDAGNLSWRERPTIVLGPETDAILAELECHLASMMFQRAGKLVKVVEHGEDAGERSCRRRANSMTITAVSVEYVQRLMSRHVRFLASSSGDQKCSAANGRDVVPADAQARGTPRKRHKMKQKAAPRNLAQLFTHCGQWNKIHTLNGLMASPFMRADGTIAQAPGYDPVSGHLLLDSGMESIVVPETPTADDAARAVACLRDLVSDFPFAGPEHFSAWLATLLTAVARPAIDGPVPMLWLDGNRRGTGKSKLGRLIGIITAGGKPTELSWTADEKEMESRIASLLNGGDTYAVFDNASGTIRNPVLERFLTCHTFDFRKFFGQELVKLPNRTTLAITGNNLTLRGDLSRRVIRCRLMTAMECPETRDGFQHADIEAYAKANQAALLAAALTILRAHAVAEFASCPVCSTRDDGTVVENPARPVGSFEIWDRVIRHAILRAGLADPMLTQDEAREEDEDDVKLAALLQAWHDRSRDTAWTVTDMLGELFGRDGRAEPTSDGSALVAALREITSTPPGKMPDPKVLAYRLRDARDKTVGGFRLRRVKKSNKGVLYQVECEGPECLACRNRRAEAE